MGKHGLARDYLGDDIGNPCFGGYLKHGSMWISQKKQPNWHIQKKLPLYVVPQSDQVEMPIISQKTLIILE